MRETPESASLWAYASQRESREKLGGAPIRSPVQGSFSMTLGSPPSTGSRYRVPVLSQKTRFFESGDQLIRRRKAWPPSVSERGSVLPSAAATTISYSPLASDT